MRKVLVANCFSPNATAIRAVMADGKALAPPRRKILVAAGTLCPGSVANVLLDTIESLPDYHFLIWVAPGQEQSAATTAHRYWRALGETKPENFSFLTSSREADALAQEIRATFLHLFTEDMWFLRWSLERDIPIVTFSHSVSYFEDYPSLANPGDRNVVWQRRAMLYARKVVCWSELEKSFICRFLPIVSEKVKIVPLCQRLPEGLPERRIAPPGRAPKVLFAGRPLAKRKGFEYLALALRRLAAKGYKPELTVADAFTKSAQLATRTFSGMLDGVAVQWLRDLSPEKMRGLYRSVHAAIIPSLYDSWCKVLTEAIAEGTPVIATESTGATEQFPRSEVPRVKTGSGEAIAEAIEELVSDYDRFLVATDRARQRLKAELTLRKYGKRLKEVISLV